MKEILLGIIIGCVIWKVVWQFIILRVYGNRIIAWIDSKRRTMELTRIRLYLKQGRGITEIAESCNYHNQDEVLAIKNEMWNNGWENS